MIQGSPCYISVIFIIIFLFFYFLIRLHFVRKIIFHFIYRLFIIALLFHISKTSLLISTKLTFKAKRMHHFTVCQSFIYNRLRPFNQIGNNALSSKITLPSGIQKSRFYQFCFNNIYKINYYSNNI